MVGEKAIGVSKIIACTLSKVIALNLLSLTFGLCCVLLFFIAFSMIIPLIAIAIARVFALRVDSDHFSFTFLLI